MRLQDKVAVITGAGQGIGRAYALRFAEEGARVAVVDIVEENARKVAAEVEGRSGEAVPLHCDVSDPSSTRKMVEEVVEGRQTPMEAVRNILRDRKWLPEDDGGSN